MNDTKKNFHYYMFHKPFGCVSARRDALYPTVMDYFKELDNPNLSPVGRLDRETEGLLLITDDGKWNQMLCNPKYGKQKRYYFLVLGDLTEEKIRQLETGVLLIGSDKPTAPAIVTAGEHLTLREVQQEIHPEVWAKVGKNRPEMPVTRGEIIITEGRKNQIRRMMKQVNCCVVVLKRYSMDGLELDEKLEPGQWRELLPEELAVTGIQ
ncbi:MAG: pseudouridine synthase [Lachnospiraceae bacterium]|nr:pseudouridine synthase [Lachnospiraceae bacterium]